MWWTNCLFVWGVVDPVGGLTHVSPSDINIVSADLISRLWFLNLAVLQTHFNYHCPSFIHTDRTSHQSLHTHLYSHGHTYTTADVSKPAKRPPHVVWWWAGWASTSFPAKCIYPPKSHWKCALYLLWFNWFWKRMFSLFMRTTVTEMLCFTIWKTRRGMSFRELKLSRDDRNCRCGENMALRFGTN